ncbi:RES family NAD+ phosphorylase [Clostridium sp. OS1-26]|uniref:RES family NAD+ phosphorylase n=1 Tax=Clostridium sp. OS1-26 TaxID=3070681 RepID=UPI0027E114A3|nr:RES family NAD+ phosphorylase [Clostridium sp. OS1-26]WML35332.1 RES family NAD+ phosphorylase [Clostridium sp. OS1-26]
MDTTSGKGLTKEQKLWYEFKEEILYRNRFMVNHIVLDYIKECAYKSCKVIKEGSILYRARIYNGSENFIKYLGNNFNNHELSLEEQLDISRNRADISLREESGFWGYDHKDSYVPSDNNLIKDGRANPAFIKYLYTAENLYTALAEVRPYMNNKVSIAKIRVDEPLNIVDFSFESLLSFNGVERKLMSLIMLEFSTPSDSDKKDYIATQYVSEFIKTLKFDGIRFSSSLHESGRNITIFNYDKCHPVGSELYEVRNIIYHIEKIVPIK